MKIRVLALFVSALAVVAALLLWSDRNSQPQSLDERVGEALMPLDTARSTTSILITPADASTILLEDRSDGVWILPNYHGLPVDFSKLSRLVQNLTDARIERFVTANPERAGRLGLGRHTIELRGSDPENTLATLVLGRRSESGGGSYFRYSGEERTYLLDRSLAPDNQASLWAAKTPLQGEEDSIRKLAFQFADGAEFSALRENLGDEFTTEIIDSTGAFQQDPFLSSLRNLLTIRYNEISPRDDEEASEAQKHIAGSATITAFDGEPIRASWGRRPEEILDDNSADENADEPEIIPAGPPFLFLEFAEDSSSPWATPARGLAFQIADFYFNRLPQDSSSWLE